MVPEQKRQLFELMNLLARWFAVESAECLQEGVAPQSPEELLEAPNSHGLANPNKHNEGALETLSPQAMQYLRRRHTFYTELIKRCADTDIAIPKEPYSHGTHHALMTCALLVAISVEKTSDSRYILTNNRLFDTKLRTEVPIRMPP